MKIRKKLLSKTYLRDVSKYEIKFDLSNDDYFLAVKHIIKTDPPFIIDGRTIIGNGTYVMELVPKNENYSMRVYFDENKNITEYYFDIIRGSGIDEESKIPYYDDLYLDVTLTDGEIKVLDEDELEEAYKNHEITKEEYDMAIEVGNKLISEIKTNTNKYINMDLKSLL